MFRSEDILSVTDFGFSDTSLTANEKEAESSVNELQDEKKVTCNYIISLFLQTVLFYWLLFKD